MYSPISKTPFLLLLMPLILGILAQYFGDNIEWSIIVALLGSAVMLFSFLLKKNRQFSLRWMFSIGVVLLFISFGGVSTFVKQESLKYEIRDSTQMYVGYVIDSPQEKPNSMAYKIHLTDEDVNVVCYLQKDSTKKPLRVGDEIAFCSELQAFKNAGNPDEFDYAKYMYNQGFVASTYLSSYAWIATGNSDNSLKMSALQIREDIMSFYELLGFEGDNLAVLSALTLGYQDTLSDDLIQGFRTTGTVHILSVSGLHVGIIFAIITFLLSFIPRHSRFYRSRFVITILLLWVYSFITGLPASVVRASFMLSVFCIANILPHAKYNALNGLYISAFFMLLYNPFWLFDVGFQLSFVSVLSILVLYKKMESICKIKNKYAQLVWQMFCISCVAQLATFPLCIYYFGTFSTYFFIGNLLIVPLVAVITYSLGLLVVASLFANLLPTYSDAIYYIPANLVRLLIEFMCWLVNVLEQLPYALFEGMEMSFAYLILISSIIVTSLIAVIRFSSRSLILSLILLFVSVLWKLRSDLETKPYQLIVYNRYSNTDIRLKVDNETISLDSLLENTENPMIEVNNIKVLMLNSKLDNRLYTNELLKVDYIIAVGEQYHTLASIAAYFEPSKIIIDGSLKNVVKKQLTKECENRNIPLYDVSKNGAFSIIF